MNITIRPIEPLDNPSIAKIIRNALEEFKANKPGTVYFDAETDNLYHTFKAQHSAYFIAEQDGILLGGAGIYPTKNLPKKTCELVKLYLSPAARGKGIGKLLINECFKKALQLGYNKIYLETMPELNIAVPLYEKMGFTYLIAPQGNSGHSGCSIWMIKELADLY